MKRITLYLMLTFCAVQMLSAQEIKVGTYNIFTSDSRKKAINANPEVSHQRYWCNSAPAVASMISELDCDVLGLQEICDSIWGVKGDNDIRKIVAKQGKVDYDWVLYPNSKSGKISYDVAIAYKKAKFELLESGIFYLGGVRDTAILAPGAPKGSQRPCVWAHLKHNESGKDFYFLSTHFRVAYKNKEGKWDNSANKYNMQRLRDISAELFPIDTPSILVGDLNADHKAKHWGSIGNARWFDVYRHFLIGGTLPQHVKDWGTQNTKDESGFSKWRPDHICLEGFRPLNIDVDHRKFPTADGTLHYPSDHLPVVSVVAFNQPVDPSVYNTPAPANAKTVRAVSANIRYMNNNNDLENGWDRRKSSIIYMMKDLKPAVIGFQECSKYQRDYILGKCPEYDYVDYLIRRDRKNLRSYAAFTDPVMWDRNVLELKEWDAFYLSETPDSCSVSWNSAEPRTALWCRFKHKKTGKEFIFINTHLDHKSPEARKRGLDVIIDKQQDFNPKKLPIIMLGDLNAQPTSDVFDRLKIDWKDSRAEAKDSDDKYTFNGFGKSWNGTVDYIWYKGFRRCHDFKVVVRKYNHVPFISDHYPVRADLEF